eukprot:5355179-Prymnesium_polylepis.2
MQPVVEALFDEIHKIGDGDRAFIEEKLALDGARTGGERDDGVDRWGQRCSRSRAHSTQVNRLWRWRWRGHHRAACAWRVRTRRLQRVREAGDHRENRWHGVLQPPSSNVNVN